MTKQSAERDRYIRDKAKSDANAIFAKWGDRSLRSIAVRSHTSEYSSEQRRHARLMVVEIERLMRLRRRGQPIPNPLVPWKPKLIGLARLTYFVRNALWPGQRAR